MRAVLDHLTADDEVGLVRFGQSNGLPNGNRDTEGFVQAPHLKLRAAGLDLTIASIVPTVAGASHGAAATRSIVNVAEVLAETNDWINGELRLVQHEFGDATTSSLRRGHAKVLSNAKLATQNTAGGLAFNSTTGRVIWAGHGRKDGSLVVFNTTGVLPGGLTAGVPVYVRGATDHTFQVATTPGGYGAAAGLAGGSGSHTITALPFLEVEWQSEFMAPTAGVTFTIGTPGIVNHTAHGLPEGSAVSFNVNTPPEIAPGAKVFIVNPTTNAYNVSATPGGAAIAFTGAGGAATATPDLLAFVSGYVHLHDRFKSYDNVWVVTPYQPIEPGDYPAGVPTVPGYTLPSDVLSYADAAVVLPYTWEEGVEGYGATGEVTVALLVATLQGGQTIPDKLFAGGFIRAGGAKGKIASNTTGTVTVESWTPPAGPGAGTHKYTLHLPHWRNNPHHYDAGEGFLYPSGGSQPGGGSPISTGQIYSRPRGRLKGSYVERQTVAAACSTAVNATGVAQVQTNASAQLTCSIVGGRLRIQRATTTNDPATQLIQFEHFARTGYTMFLLGLGQTPSVDGFWRVMDLQHVTAAAGSYIDLEPLDASLVSVPGAVAGAVPSGAKVTRMVWEPIHRFGSLIELAFRMAMSIGRRVVVAHLAVNAAGQILRKSNNLSAFQGKIGWFDDDEAHDWTPSNPDGCAARLKRLVEFIAPRAVQASFGTSRLWKVLALDGWNAETDAMTAAGRELAKRSIPVFANWLRAVVTTAGLSPYPKSARIPLHWAKITTVPWEEAAFGFDVDGLVRAAITRLATLDGFAVAFDPDASPKLPDLLHFNGVGEALNGKGASDLLLPLIDFAFQFALGPGAIDVANEALSLLGEAANVTALEPPNATTGARLCAQFMPEARKLVLQRHPYTFATRRVLVVEIENTVASWQYAYAVPADLLHPTAVLDPQAADDVQIGAPVVDATGRSVVPTTVRLPASQRFRMETEDGYRVLRTNQADAKLIYTAGNVDFELWDPLARQACVYQLASLVAGGTMKGKTGAAVARSMLEMSMALTDQSAAQNAAFQQDMPPENRCPWLP